VSSRTLARTKVLLEEARCQRDRLAAALMLASSAYLELRGRTAKTKTVVARMALEFVDQADQGPVTWKPG
jgi:hypothetical protein